jgi:S1-C subfamily serine protease
MAEALASRVKAEGTSPPPLVIGIMGGGHVRNGYGVPHQLRDLGVKSIGTLIPADTLASCSELKAGFADAVFAVQTAAATAEAPPPPRLGIQLELADGNVRVVAVSSGSLAERTGMKAGDRIVSVAGSPAATVGTVTSAVRAALPGTWLPLQVRRGDSNIDLVVKFPPKS